MWKFQKARQVSLRRDLYLRTLNASDVGVAVRGMSVLRPPGFTPDSNETMAKLLRSWEAELPKGELKAFRRRVAEPKQASSTAHAV